jgi:sugar O-acyltransferase (sialic acid O-acetyltransferase NeuD family)
LAIIGAGDLGVLIAHHARACGYTVIGFFDSRREVGAEVRGSRVLGGNADIAPAYARGEFDAVISAIGYKHLAFRREQFLELSRDVPFASVVHPSCCVDPSATVESGCFLLPGCTLDAGVVVRANSVLNTGCNIAHDSTIGAHTFLGPGVTVAGFVKIGERCFIGVGSVLIDNLTIADGTQTGGGAVVTRAITEAGLYVGIPAALKRAVE